MNTSRCTASSTPAGSRRLAPEELQAFFALDLSDPVERARVAGASVAPESSVLPRGDDGATAQAAATARADTKCLSVIFDYRTWPAKRTHRFPSVAAAQGPLRGFPASLRTPARGPR